MSSSGNASAHARFMRRAIELGRISGLVKKTGGPFGAVVVKNGQIVGEGSNRVLSTRDPSAHGEIVAIREACRRLRTHDLSGCILYTSAECCGMCYSASFWARISRIYYAATHADALLYGDFDDTPLEKQLRRRSPHRQPRCVPLLRTEALVVWKDFRAMPNRAWY
ncbi:MAG: nucleoside deaminase [Verrucomicrobia bacterium]|jgi:guanine deaminase|nr:nucleoside deaminase [Verrucomicrobiota bacterium]MDA0857918.1 nucleoside deaminase [Verrucomicrobiota bacterium]